MIPVSTPRRLNLSSSVKIVVDGNSIYAGQVGETMAQSLLLIPRISAAGVTQASVAIGGQTWRMMDGEDGGSSADVDAALDITKTCILICAEGTNAIGNSPNYTGAQVMAQAATYIGNRRMSWMARGGDPRKLKVILCSTLPRDGAANTTNTQLSVFDLLARAKYREAGSDVFCDYRTGTSPFNHSGTDSAVFQAQSVLWKDQWLHPSTDGQRIMAGMIANAIYRLPV